MGAVTSVSSLPASKGHQTEALGARLPQHDVWDAGALGMLFLRMVALSCHCVPGVPGTYGIAGQCPLGGPQGRMEGLACMSPTTCTSLTHFF